VKDHKVENIVKGGTADDQKKLGTAAGHIVAVRKQMQELMERGDATPELFEDTLMTILRSLEVERIEQERYIKDYERKIEFCRAKQQAASQYSSLVVGILMTKSREVRLPRVDRGDGGNGTTRITDKEMLQRICACGCVDEEDASKCDCVCHQGGYCDNPECVVCPARRLQDEAEKQRANEEHAPEIEVIDESHPAKKPRKKAVRKK